MAAWKGHAGMVEMLIRAGCNTLAHSHNGKTALQLAQEEDQHECVTLLQSATSKVSGAISTLASFPRCLYTRAWERDHKHTGRLPIAC